LEFTSRRLSAQHCTDQVIAPCITKLQAHAHHSALAQCQKLMLANAWRQAPCNQSQHCFPAVLCHCQHKPNLSSLSGNGSSLRTLRVPNKHKNEDDQRLDHSKNQISPQAQGGPRHSTAGTLCHQNFFFGDTNFEEEDHAG
jgi:hypothetical protein